MKLQAQAVLRRPDLEAPLRLAGVLMAGSFYPLTPQDAWGPLHLEVGLVALAPLTPVVVTELGAGAALAMREARAHWSAVSDSKAALLSWRHVSEVRDGGTEGEISALIALMTTANDERMRSTPSTPLYQGAARELERLAGLVGEASSAGSRWPATSHVPDKAGTSTVDGRGRARRPTRSHRA